MIIDGTFEIDGPRGLLDAYEIRIEIGKDFPIIPPTVVDAGGRLPRDIDRHVFSDGRVCLEVWPVWLARNPQPTVGTVLQGPIRNFFLSQSVFETSGNWPFGHYAHGDAGRREALRDILRANSTDDKDLLWRANALVNPPRRQNACPCRGGKLWRKCHREELQAIGRSLDQAGLWLIADMYLGVLERSKVAGSAAE